MADRRTAEAVELMMRYAERTGLASERPPRRYLWTDAFAVCNFLGLARTTGDEAYLRLALDLIDQVHRVLGRHRDDDARHGWISGSSEAEGAAHPTRGGLRIGKRLPERGAGQPFQERLEWDRDGQYFHYLTKWMQALDQAARATGQASFNTWARELADAAYGAFVYTPPGFRQPRMYWKMSIDLKRPLVASMGQHDPLDGYVTYAQLRATAARMPAAALEPDIGPAAEGLAGMIARPSLATADPLGLGGLLLDAARVAQLMGRGAFADPGLLADLLGAALTGLEHYAAQSELRAPADYRLAFRELGLALGLEAAARLQAEAEHDPARFDEAVRTRLEALGTYASLHDEIEAFWRNRENRRAGTWTEHRDINEVMLASVLAPEGFLDLPEPP